MILKYLFDKIAAFLGLLLASPILLIVAISIKFSMPGPVFFIQSRVGRNARLFRMVKFRTMQVIPNANIKQRKPILV